MTRRVRSVCSVLGLADVHCWLRALALVLITNPVMAASLWSIDAEPVWGSQAEIVEPESQNSPGGRYYNVAETQRHYQTDPAETIFYGRTVYTINNVSGLDQSDAISIDFDPLYQTVVLHKAQILRGGDVISQLDEKNIQLLQRETELESGLYNGLQTLHLLLSDQRVGDQIEYSYSLVGQNPVFAGHVFGWAQLQASAPVGRYLFSISYPENKAVTYKSYFKEVTAVEESVDGRQAITWQARHTKPSRYQSDVPAGFIAQTYIQYTDFADWAAVSAWAAPLFEQPQTVHSTVASKARALRNNSLDTEQLISSAISFVQDDIRYTGINTGIGGYKPDAPHEILQRRFGDCKDKAILLVALLKDLGIKAYPALVHSYDGEDIPSYLPSPDAFNHMIVKLPHHNVDYWVDGTRTLQGSSLVSLAQGRYHHALVMDEALAGLEKIEISAPEQAGKEVHEEYELHHNFEAQDTMLTVTTTYRGAQAERMRRSVQSKGSSRILRDYVEYYENRFGVVNVEAPLTIEDNRRNNVLVMTERYGLPQAWLPEDDEGTYSFEFMADAALEYLSLPNDQRRSQPVAQSYPVASKHTISIDIADGWSLDAEEFSVSNEFFNLDFSSRISGTQLVLNYSFKTLGNVVPVNRARAYIADLKAAREQAYFPIEFNLPADQQGTYHLEHQLTDIGSWFRQTAQALSNGEENADATTSSR